MINLPINKIPGVGKVNDIILTHMNYITCKDVLENPVTLFINFTEHAFEFLLKASLGISRFVHDDENRT